MFRFSYSIEFHAVFGSGYTRFFSSIGQLHTRKFISCMGKGRCISCRLHGFDSDLSLVAVTFEKFKLDKE